MRHLPAYLLVTLALFSSCGRGRRISEAKFAEIYADMFLADQWISSNRLGRIADTSLVYEPIFEMYGFTTEDYRNSLMYYMDDATAFADVLEEARSILRDRVDHLTKVREYQVLRDSVRAVMARTYEPISLPPDTIMGPYTRELHRREAPSWNRYLSPGGAPALEKAPGSEDDTSYVGLYEADDSVLFEVEEGAFVEMADSVVEVQADSIFVAPEDSIPHMLAPVPERLQREDLTEVEDLR